MSDIAIRVEGLGKQYRIGRRERYRTLRDTITETITAPVRHVGSLLRGRTPHDEPSDLIWALRDVSFEVPAGSVVGVIGRNGAGKSTLLKILSRITEQTEGRIEIRGRVGSLLEVGTGFHPELSGRENIFLNGAILGMRRAEIIRKFDEIVSFAEVERFIDTPVKHYSTGMYMRLAFSVAAHLEPEILLVDEVLAVGDTLFQKKCLGKIGDVARGGRTVVFVSHNMAAIRELCSVGLLLRDGALVHTSSLDDAVGQYAGLADQAGEWRRSETHANEAGLVFQRLRCEVTGDQPNLTLSIEGDMRSVTPHAPAFLAFDVFDSYSVPLFQSLPEPEPFIAWADHPIHFEASIDLPPLVPGTYRVSAWAGTHYERTLDLVDSALAFTILFSPTPGRTYPPHLQSRGDRSLLIDPASREPRSFTRFGPDLVLRRIVRAIVSIPYEADGVGVLNVVRIRAIGYYNRVASKLRAPAWWPTIRLKVPGCPTTLYLRTGTSDYAVLRQVFVEQQYAPLDGVAAKLVIDCGAYVGYSALYFLNRFPQAVVVAVEPSPENAALCRRNLQPYHERVHLIRAAVWGRPGPMRLIRGVYGDGRDWANQVEPVAPANADVEGIDLPSLIRLAGAKIVDILKIDIERSEIELFRNETETWLPSVRNVAIELHDRECERVFFDALEPYETETLRSGELTICRSIAKARSTGRVADR